MVQFSTAVLPCLLVHFSTAVYKKPLTYLDPLLEGLSDDKKLMAYPQLIGNYKRFIGRKSIDWFEPPYSEWKYQDISVRVNPELGLRINSVSHVIKLYFKKDKLSKRKSDVIVHLMNLVLSNGRHQDLMMGVLDIPNSKLITPTVPIPNLDLLLNSEAAAFIQIWKGL